MKQLKKLKGDAEMLADVKAYDAVKARVDRGEDDSYRWKSPGAALPGKQCKDLARVSQLHPNVTGEGFQGVCAGCRKWWTGSNRVTAT